ncbi:MAG: glycosyltransferase family 61 protein [Muribaculaceae bacterium]|nr:glycosyltransferase family 61 protein [Muribaculaceae bacterium]
MIGIYTSDKTAETPLKELYAREFLLQSPLRAAAVDHAVILPARGRQGGVVDGEGQFVAASAYRHEDVHLWGGSYEVEESAVETVPETVIFIGQIFGHWGNFLFDCLARLWYALEEETPHRLAYCSMQEEEGILGRGRYREFLELLGIRPERLIDIRKTTRFRRVIIPQLSIFPGTFCTRECLAVFERAAAAAERAWKGVSHEKIYFTRTQMPNCKELGEREVEKVFRRLGYTVIAPEQLPAAEQIALLSRCKAFASIEGTASHNIVFAREGTEHIILRKQSYRNTRQVLFDRLRKIEPQYIDIYYEPFRGFPLSHDAGPFWVGVTAPMRAWMREHGLKMALPERFAQALRQAVNAAVYALKCVYYKYVLKY